MHLNANAVGADGISETLKLTRRDAEIDGLVLERLPNGEMAWLRPATPDPLTRYRLTGRVVIEDEPRYVITDEGRVALVEHALEDQARAHGNALLFGTRDDGGVA